VGVFYFKVLLRYCHNNKQIGVFNEFECAEIENFVSRERSKCNILEAVG
jgi:hypothetical protein